MRHQRFVLLAFVAGAVFVAAALQSAAASALLQMAVEDTRLLGGLLTSSTALALVAGFGTFWGLVRSSQAVKFVDEVVGEMLKVTWPTREEALSASSTVIFTALFVAVLIGMYDFVWKNVADFFLFTEG